MAYPARINYTANSTTGLPARNRVFFDYEFRGDSLPTFLAGSRVGGPTKRLTKIRTETDAGARQLLEYRLQYGASPRTGRLRLESLLLCSSRGECLPYTNFSWTVADTEIASTESTQPSIVGSGGTHFGDFNGDGRTDIMMRATGWGETRLLMSNGDGTWQPLSVSALEGLNCCINAPDPANDDRITTAIVAEADVNGDGIQDIVVRQIVEDRKKSVKFTGRVITHISSGRNTWVTEPQLLQVDQMSGHGLPMVVGDFDGDGRADLLFRGKEPADNIRMFFSNGNGTWRNVLFDPPAGTGNWINDRNIPVLVGDFDGDGKADLTFPSAAGGGTPLMLSNGDTTWRVTNFITPGWAHTSSALPGDFNGDGKKDLLFDANVLYAAGDGSWFPVPGAFPSNINTDIVNSGRCGIGDFNGDGRHDVAYGCVGSDPALTFLFTQASGNWQTISDTTPSTPRYAGSRAMVDVNGDGRADIVSRRSSTGLIPVIFGTANNGEEIKTITSGAGGSIEIEIGSLTQGNSYTRTEVVAAPLVVMNPAMRVVKSVKEDMGVTLPKVTTYSYDSAIAEIGSGRGFLGFAAVTVDDAGLDIRTITKYRYDWPYVGREKSYTLQQGSNVSGTSPVVLTFRAPQYTCQNPATAPATVAPGAGAAAFAPGQAGNCVVAPGSRYQIWASRTSESHQDLNRGLLPGSRTEVSDMDKFGNPGRVTVTTLNPDGNTSGHFKVTDTWYSNKLLSINYLQK